MSQNSVSTRTLLLMGIQDGGILNAVVEELAQHTGLWRRLDLMDISVLKHNICFSIPN